MSAATGNGLPHRRRSKNAHSARSADGLNFCRGALAIINPVRLLLVPTLAADEQNVSFRIEGDSHIQRAYSECA
jgi:hypothetical protein